MGKCCVEKDTSDGVRLKKERGSYNGSLCVDSKDRERAGGGGSTKKKANMPEKERRQREREEKGAEERGQ